MKKFYTLLTMLMLAGCLLAQVPQSFNYQAVVRDGGGNIISNTQIGMRISILQGSTSGTAVCIEEYTISTNDFGLVTLAIGIVNTTDFGSIDWSADSYFVKVEIDQAGGTDYIDMGTTQLLSVPYALHANTVENITEVDGSITNEIQDLSNSVNGNDVTINITDGTGTTFSIDDGDSDNTNELQTLEFSNDTLSLSEGNNVVLPYDLSGWERKEDTLFYLKGNIGIGTENPTQKLEVNGNVWANTFFTPSIANYNKYQLMGMIDGYSIGVTTNENVGFVNTWANAFTWRNAPGYGWIWRTYEGTGLMSLNTEGKLYLKSTAHFEGSVGIGTSSPAAKLEVADTPTGTNDPVAIRITNLRSSLNLFWELRAYDSGAGGPYGRFSIFGGISGGTDKLVITTTGNVGIGTIDPKSKLQVVGLPEYADNATAVAAGLTIGAFYRTGDLLKVVH